MTYPKALVASSRYRALNLAAATFMVAAAIIGSHSARAANYYWAPTQGVLGGDGNWATSGATNWTTDSTGGGTHVSWHNTTADVAFFNGADGTYSVTLGTTPMLFNTINFNADGYTLSAASPSTLSDTRTTSSTTNITIASGKTVTIGNNVTVTTSASNGLNLIGGGTVVFDSGSAFSTTTRLWVGGQTSNALNAATVVKLETGASISTVQDLVVNAAFLVEGGTASSTLSFLIGQQANTGTAANLTITNGSATATTGVRFGSSASIANHGGTLNLDGGTLTTPKIYQTAAVTGISSTVNFNGGTLKPTANDNSTFLTGLNTVQVRNGGAKIDTNGFDVTIGQALTHSVAGGDNATDGGLTKQGAGVLTISGSNTYTGVTSVQGGTLKLASGGSIANSTAYSISNNAIFDVSSQASYSLSGVDLTIGTNGVGAGLLDAGTIAMTLGGNLTVNFASSILADGSVDLYTSGVPTGAFVGVGLSGNYVDTFSRPGGVGDIWQSAAPVNGYNFSFDQSSGVLSFAAVPEPSTYALFMSGMLVALVFVRRRNRMAE